MIWTNKTASLATKGQYFSQWSANKIVFDSRLIEPGDLFIALPGKISDGHQHVLNALERGASAAIVSKIPNNITNKEQLFIVEDVLTALHDLAKYKRTHSKAKFIAITGSVGKTSTKEQLGIALSPYGKTFYSRANYNNHLGVPINLASLPNDTDFAVFELGMDHAGEISPLSKMIQPHVAIITSIEGIHLANFDSIEGIANAKAEIFDGILPKGIAIINSLSNCHSLLYKKAKSIDHIFNIGIDSKLIEYSVKENKTIANLNILGQSIIITLDNILGAHQIQNMITTLTCVASLDLKPSNSINALKQFKLPRGRGLVSKIVVEGKHITLIDDSYNAGPISMKAALKNMSYYNGKKIAILGDMVDLGPKSLELHVGLQEDIINNNIDKVICFGNQMQNLYKALPEDKRLGSYLNLKNLAKDLPNKLTNGDILLIKGSLYINNLYGFAKHLTDNTLDKI